jgi:hypothetical protein
MRKRLDGELNPAAIWYVDMGVHRYFPSQLPRTRALILAFATSVLVKESARVGSKQSSRYRRLKIVQQGGA